jgi:hypothetical protein
MQGCETIEIGAAQPADVDRRGAGRCFARLPSDQSGACRWYGRWPSDDRLEDLAVVDALQVDGGNAEVRVTQLTLDHIERHTTALSFDG